MMNRAGKDGRHNNTIEKASGSVNPEPISSEEGPGWSEMQLWAQGRWTPAERQWVAETHALVRFLRAKRLDVNAAKQSLEATLTWRQAYLPNLETSIKETLESSLIRIMPDNTLDGYTAIMVEANAGGTLSNEEKVALIVWSIETALAIPSRERRIVWVADFEKLTEEPTEADSWGFLKAMIGVMQSHYPDTMRRVIFWRPSMMMRSLLSMASAIIDTRVMKKIAIVAPASYAGDKEVCISPQEESMLRSMFRSEWLPVHMAGCNQTRPPRVAHYRADLERRILMAEPERHENVHRAAPVTSSTITDRRVWGTDTTVGDAAGGGKLCPNNRMQNSMMGCTPASASGFGGAAMGGVGAGLMTGLIIGTAGVAIPVAFAVAGVGYAYGSGYMSKEEAAAGEVPVVTNIGKVQSPRNRGGNAIEEGVVPRVVMPDGSNADSASNVRTCGFF